MVRRCAVAVVLCLQTACEEEPQRFGNRTYLSESIEGRELVPESRLRLEFASGGDFLGHAGCNTLQGRYQLADGRLVASRIAHSEVGCSTPLGDILGQEEWFIDFLSNAPSYEIDEPRLVLSNDDVTIVFLDREVADPDRPLESSRWEVNGLVGNLVFSANHEGEATLRLVDGLATIVTPCAEGRANYEIDGASLGLREAAISEPKCPGDEFSPYYDEHMREVLADGELEWEIEAARLTLMRGDVGLILRTE